MSTPYNDQWVLPRGQQVHGAGSAPGAEQDEDADAVSADVPVARHHERPRPARAARGLCKRPKWIDRDT